MIQIDELVIRVPGWNETQCKAFSRNIAMRLSQVLPPVTDNHKIPEWKIQMDSGTEPDEMATRIAEQIARQMKMATI